MTGQSPNLPDASATAPHVQNPLTRRSAMTSSVASAVANKPSVVAPPIAGINPDAALLEVGDRFDLALEDWRKAVEACQKKIGKIYDPRGRVIRLEERVRDIQDEIEAMPAAQSLEGLAVKARCALWQINFGLDQETQLVDLAEQVLRATGLKLPTPVF